MENKENHPQDMPYPSQEMQVQQSASIVVKQDKIDKVKEEVCAQTS